MRVMNDDICGFQTLDEAELSTVDQTQDPSELPSTIVHWVVASFQAGVYLGR